MTAMSYSFINENLLKDDLWNEYPLIDDEVEKNYEATYDILRGVDSTLSGVANYIILDGIYDGMRVFQGAHEITHILGLESGNIARLPRRDARTNLTVIAYKPDYERYGPIRIIDNISDTQVATIIPFDPLRGYVDPVAAREIDYFGEDPMRFGSDEEISESTWMDPKVGKIWLDGGTVGYRPYNLSHQYSNISRQLMDWGKAADWATFSVYQWTRSEEHPDDYNAAALLQEGDFSIPVDRRASGKVKESIFYDGMPLRSSDLSLEFWRGEYDSSQNNTITFNNFMRYSIPHDEESPPAPINIYINGVFVKTTNYSELDRDLSIANVRDHIRLERSLIDPETEDEYIWVDRRVDYLEREELNRDGSKKIYYYFWVSDKKIPQYGRNMSLYDIRRRYIMPDSPYFLMNGFTYDNTPNGMDKYARMYIRNIRQYITEGDRFVLQIPSYKLIKETMRKGNKNERDELQTEIRKYITGQILYEKKEEWEIFNESKFNKIPKGTLWNVVVESLIGFELHLEDGNEVITEISLPYSKFTRFDIKRGSNTEYGLNKGQIINSSETIIDIVTTILMSGNDKERSGYTKGEISKILQWDTPEKMKSTMDFIYDEMPISTVNGIFLAIVRDSMSKGYSVDDIMKTSYIQNKGKFRIRTGE